MGPCYSVKAAYSDQRCPDRRETCKCKQNNSRPSPIPYTIRDSWSDVCGEAHSTGLFRLTVLTYARTQWSVAVSLRMIRSQQAPVFAPEFHYSVSFFLRACNSSALLTPPEQNLNSTLPQSKNKVIRAESHKHFYFENVYPGDRCVSLRVTDWYWCYNYNMRCRYMRDENTMHLDLASLARFPSNCSRSVFRQTLLLFPCLHLIFYIS